eukprot:s1718_g6.t1
MKYTLLGQRCAMAHDRLAEHSGSNWRRVAEPVLGAGGNISEESVHRVALECGWQVTWMTDEDVSVSLEGLLQLPQRVCHHKAECRPQSFLILLQFPQEMWYRKAECQTLSFLILCLRLLLFPIQASSQWQAGWDWGTRQSADSTAVFLPSCCSSF